MATLTLYQLTFEGEMGEEGHYDIRQQHVVAENMQQVFETYDEDDLSHVDRMGSSIDILGWDGEPEIQSDMANGEEAAGD